MISNTAAHTYCRGRMDKVLGRKLATNLWLRPTEHGTFQVIQVISKYIEVVDEHKNVTSPFLIRPAKVTRDKSKWRVDVVGEIHSDHSIMYKEVSQSQQEWIFGVRSYRPTSVKIEGRQYISNTDKLVTPLPLKIMHSGHLVRMVPERVRVIDKDKKLELDRLARKVRNAFKVRAKIGAFKGLPTNFGDFAQIVCTQHEFLRDTHWYFSSTGDKLKIILQEVDSSELESFYPIIFGIFNGWYWGYERAVKNGQLSDPEYLVGEFDKFMLRARKRMNEATGAIHYAEPERDRSTGQVEVVGT